MSSLFDSLVEKGILKRGQFPPFIKNSIHYETIMGSIAYGANLDTSDFDVYAVCIPPKEIIFPHTDGYINGFGKKPPTFDSFDKHHIQDPDAEGGKGRSYDFAVYSIVRYFQLCMECNPNMIDSLFTPRRCVLHSTRIGEMIRENRHLFLHKGAWHRFKGYAYSSMKKLYPSPDVEIVQKFENQHDLNESYPLSAIEEELARRGIDLKATPIERGSKGEQTGSISQMD